MAFSMNSTIKELLADERARAVVEKHIPGASRHPNIYDVYYETLKSVSYYPEAAAAGLTKEKLAAIDADLRALG